MIINSSKGLSSNLGGFTGFLVTGVGTALMSESLDVLANMFGSCFPLSIDSGFSKELDSDLFS